MKIREQHNVQITFPKKEDGSEDKTITIVGYEKDALAAQESIMKIVNELVSQFRVIVLAYPELLSFIGYTYLITTSYPSLSE